VPRNKYAIKATHPILVRIFEEQDLLGMRGVDLSTRSGIDQQKISRLRRGRHQASIQDVEALAEAVRMEVKLVSRELSGG